MSKQYKTRSQLKNAAKDSLMGHYGSAVLITFLSALIPSVVSFFLSQISAMTGLAVPGLSVQANNILISVIFFLISLTCSAVLGVMQLGISLFFLNLACGQTASVKNLFYGFREPSNEALAVSAVLVLLDTLCMAPYQEFARLYLTTLDDKWITYTFAAAAIGMVIYVPLSLGLSMAFFLMLDFPDKGSKEILKLSMRVMKGHKFRLFVLELSFLPLILLCFLSFGIGLLWLMPYMNMTMAMFFLDLMKPETNGEAL